MNTEQGEMGTALKTTEERTTERTAERIAEKTSEKTVEKIVEKIPEIGLKHHRKRILELARFNREFVDQSLRDLPRPTGKKADRAVVISAGPSVKRDQSIEKIKASGFDGTIISVDGSYVSCLREGLIPDYVLTLDPHATRIVRWFGDKNFEENSRVDKYFERQDLDVEFRSNSIKRNLENLELVNRFGHETKAIVATTAPPNVVERLKEAEFDIYWWNPLVDNPSTAESVTRELYKLNSIPCMNTGGTVGTASWVFASDILKIPKIAVVGMDFGYYIDTPVEKTQTYYELAVHQGGTLDDMQKFFETYEYPLTGEKFYTDPTYRWYRQNFMELVKLSSGRTINCTGGGTLFGEGLSCMNLSDFLNWSNL